MNNNLKTYYSQGKLLISGEYVILDGAKGLALPTKLGQSLKVIFNQDFEGIHWKSYDYTGQLWYENNFGFDDKKNSLWSESKDEVSQRIQQIFNAIFKLNTNFLNEKKGIFIETHLEFNRFWGLGTSSTLINNLANWAKIDAYQLLKLTFGGSGYQLFACAQNPCTITYQIKNSKKHIHTVNFNPPFKSNLYFVYLNEKQNSRLGIAHYKTQKKDDGLINEISTITEFILKTTTPTEFNQLIYQHEKLISKAINLPTVQDKFFPDFKGQIKSLGAWGGDFVLVSSFKNPTDYFKNKGFDVVLKYDDLI